MHGHHTLPLKLRDPLPVQVERQIMDARRMFHRSLGLWASDVLRLKHAKLHCMTWRGADAIGASTTRAA